MQTIGKRMAMALVSMMVFSLLVAAVPYQADADSVQTIRIDFGEDPADNEAFLDGIRGAGDDIDKNLTEGVMAALVSEGFEYVEDTLSLGKGHVYLAYKHADDGAGEVGFKIGLDARLKLGFEAIATHPIHAIGIPVDINDLDELSMFIAISNPSALGLQNVNIAAGTVYDVVVEADVLLTADIRSVTSTIGTEAGDGVSALSNISVRADGTLSVKMTPKDGGAPIDTHVGIRLDLGLETGFEGVYQDYEDAYGELYVVVNKLGVTAAYSLNGRSTSVEPAGTVTTLIGVKIPTGESYYPTQGLLGNLESDLLQGLEEFIGDADIQGLAASDEAEDADELIAQIEDALVTRAPAEFYAYSAALIVAGIIGLAYVIVRRG